MRAERQRQRLPRRGPAARWSRRIAGLVGTAALIGVGVVSAQMILPDKGERVISAAPAATQTPTPNKKGKHAVRKKTPGLTKAQRAARADAVAEVRRQGYTTLKPSQYDPKATLRVLIGRPVGDAAGGYHAFFFARGAFLGKDTLSPSTRLRVVKQGKTSVTLAYGVYQTGDAAGHPSATSRVSFKLVGTTVTPQAAIPLGGARYQRATG